MWEFAVDYTAAPVSAQPSQDASLEQVRNALLHTPWSGGKEHMDRLNAAVAALDGYDALLRQALEAADFLINRFDQQINGAGETCWTVGLRSQISDMQYEWAKYRIADLRSRLEGTTK